MNIEIRMGQAIDSLSILRLKKMFTDVNVDDQITELSEQVGDAESEHEAQKLASVNLCLWLLENKVRDDPDFFESYARAIFDLNEIRAELKKQVDLKHHSDSSEGKVYERK